MFNGAKKVYRKTRNGVKKQSRMAVDTVAPVIDGVLMPIGYMGRGVKVLFDKTRNMLVFVKDKATGSSKN
jgi:hypothetical protein